MRAMISMSTSKLVKYSTVTAEIWVVSFISLSSLCSAANAARLLMEDLKQTSQDGQLLLRAFHRLNLYLLNLHLLVFLDLSDGSIHLEGFSLSNSAILEPFEGESYAVTDHEESGSIVLYPDTSRERSPAHTSVCPVCPE